MAKFHAAIKDNELSSVEHFILESPDLKNCFGPNNKPALCVAIEKISSNRKYDVFALLRYHQFTSLGDDEYQKIFNQLSKTSLKGITEAGLKFYGKAFETHIAFIYSNTFFGFGYDNEKQKTYRDEIIFYLDELNKIVGIIPILKVIEHSHSLVIVFDFEPDNVSGIDLNS